MKSYGSSVFQYLRTTSDTRTWATAYKQNSKSTYNLSYERYGATIKVFTARTAIPLPSPLLPRERRGNRRRDDISWNNTAIVDSIRFLLLIFLSQILPIWILLRYDDTAFRRVLQRNGRILTREGDGAT